MHNWRVNKLDADETRGGRRWTRTIIRFLLTVTAMTLVMVGISLIPVQYVIMRPGPTVDVLGSQGEVEVLEVGEIPEELDLVVRESLDTDGTLQMVTVSERGGPGSTVRVGDVIRAWFDPSASIRKYADVYPPEVTADDIQEISQAQMVSSHSTASIAAFDYLNVPLETTLTVVGTTPGSGSEGVLLEGDILRAITTPDGDRHPVDSPSVPFVLLQDVPADSELKVEVLRDGQPQTVTVITHQPVDEQGEPVGRGSKMGAYLDADADSPLDVTIHLERIGGPSAGLAFALGIIDLFGPESMTGGEHIAATGALDYAADVTPVGGVAQKVYGARRDGAEWFLIPYDNCADLNGKTPSGITVVPVRTLQEGLDTVAAIGSHDTKNLPACPL